MLAFATLCKKRKKYRLISMYGCPHARLCRLDCPRILRLNSRTCSRTYCGCLRTSLRTKNIFLRTIIASIYECDFREESHMVVGHFKRYFKYTLYIIISMNIVMSTSKDWPFIQIFAYLWSFLSISAFVSIIFCNFAVKQQKSIMAKLNRIRVVIAERDLNNKWLSDKLGKDPATVSKWVTNTTQPSLEALIAIANALEVPVQELVRQEEFNQEK